ncbi:helix-turn-helix transcriptional regulator [Salinibacter altiplanensis]|uniref:helix-turn-helix transcriptional regulator n=1 Tax=Salinibacter altiplanensis TaxID=1803181 RepID=UPI000C9EF8E4|nr:helix-turn-helix transcriptional regulator [Salinibacter altiplanensis]
MNVAERVALIEDELAAFREGLSVSDEAPDSVRLATARIHGSLFDPALTVTDIREDLSLTSTTFSARFRRHHGCTPACYIRRRRVEAAKSLLQYDDLTIADIAFHVGYEHYRTFARVFKRLTGRSPQAFREHRQSS